MISAYVTARRLKSCLLCSMYDKSALQDRLNSSRMAVDWSTQAVSIYNNALSNMTWQEAENKLWLTALVTMGILLLIQVTCHFNIQSIKCDKTK